MLIVPVARIYTPFTSKFGIPRQSGLADVEGRIVFEPEFRSPDAVRGMEGFSHLWLIWGFSEAEYSGGLTVRPPRLGGNKRVGVFASRSPYRPNSLGLSCVRLLQIETDVPDAPALIVAGADMLSSTPIYDIKPYLPFADSVPEASGGYADGVKDDDVAVSFDCDISRIPEDDVKKITALLAGDPRPHYQEDHSRVYAFEFDGLHIEFTAAGGEIKVGKLEKI